MDAYIEGRQAHCDYEDGLRANRDNPYCMEDPRWSDFEMGMLQAYEDSLSADAVF